VWTVLLGGLSTYLLHQFQPAPSGPAFARIAMLATILLAGLFIIIASAD
jgi:hypothetical protein